MDILQNKKVNSRFELSNTLEIGHYQTGGTKKDTYGLKGVVVHNGTADFGHYYSYI